MTIVGTAGIGALTIGALTIGALTIGALSMPVVGIFLFRFGIVGVDVTASGTEVVTIGGAATGGVAATVPLLASENCF